MVIIAKLSAQVNPFLKVKTRTHDADGLSVVDGNFVYFCLRRSARSEPPMLFRPQNNPTNLTTVGKSLLPHGDTNLIYPPCVSRWGLAQYSPTKALCWSQAADGEALANGAGNRAIIFSLNVQAHVKKDTRDIREQLQNPVGHDDIIAPSNLSVV